MPRLQRKKELTNQQWTSLVYASQVVPPRLVEALCRKEIWQQVQKMGYPVETLTLGVVMCKHKNKTFVDYAPHKGVPLYKERFPALEHGDIVVLHSLYNERKKTKDMYPVVWIGSLFLEFVGRVISRGSSYALQRTGKLSFLPAIPLRLAKDVRIADGDRVVANFSSIQHLDETRFARVIRVLQPENKEQQSLSIIEEQAKINHQFIASTLIPDQSVFAKIHAQKEPNREDWRHLPFVTIDGETAKDHDDAVYAQILPNGNFLLHVAIADVDHYVAAGSAIDIQAAEQATSVYFVQSVVPMLPELLSNNLCSLLPFVDRRVLAVVIELGKRGAIIKTRFALAWICSKAKLTYTQVDVWRENAFADTPIEFASSLQVLAHITEVLLKHKEKRQALQFYGEELVIQVANDLPVAIGNKPRGYSQLMIEEAMILANRVAAQKMEHIGFGMYRNHSGFEESRLQEVLPVFRSLRLLDKNDAFFDHAKVTQLQAQYRDSALAPMLDSLLLRCLCLAEYSANLEGHYGLALQHYCHFTSPIRRYPDLVVHRIIRASLFRQVQPYTQEQLYGLALQSSYQERAAEQASREVVLWCKYFWLQHGGETLLQAQVGKIENSGVQLYIPKYQLPAFLPRRLFEKDPHQLQVSLALGNIIEIVILRIDLEALTMEVGLPPIP